MTKFNTCRLSNMSSGIISEKEWEQFCILAGIYFSINISEKQALSGHYGGQLLSAAFCPAPPFFQISPPTPSTFSTKMGPTQNLLSILYKLPTEFPTLQNSWLILKFWGAWKCWNRFMFLLTTIWKQIHTNNMGHGK